MRTRCRAITRQACTRPPSGAPTTDTNCLPIRLAYLSTGCDAVHQRLAEHVHEWVGGTQGEHHVGFQMSIERVRARLSQQSMETQWVIRHATPTYQRGRGQQKRGFITGAHCGHDSLQH